MVVDVVVAVVAVAVAAVAVAVAVVVVVGVVVVVVVVVVGCRLSDVSCCSYGFSLADCLVQIPLFLESFLLSCHGLNPLMDQNHIPLPMEYQKQVFHSFVELADP